MSDVDVSAFDMGEGSATADPASLSTLNAKIEEMTALQEAVDQMEEDLRAAKRELNHLRTAVLPDIMAELQIDDLTHNGWRVSVSDFVSGTLPKDPDAQQAAIAHLESLDAGGIIKTDVAVPFGRDQYDVAKALYDRLNSDGLPVSLDTSVHPQTYQKFIRDALRDGLPISLETLGAYTGKVVKAAQVKK